MPAGRLARITNITIPDPSRSLFTNPYFQADSANGSFNFTAAMLRK